jgi:metal-sulfur cluster biosynthetic enzyme
VNLTKKLVRDQLQEKVIDPELGINIVDLGLVYEIQVSNRGEPKVRVEMTLTTPGCPLAAVFAPMVRQALEDIPGLDPYQDVEVELTFDPPWHQGMLSERAKAELGFGDGGDMP